MPYYLLISTPIRRWLAPPVFDDDDKTRVATIFNTLVLSASTLLFAVVAIQITLGIENSRNVFPTLVTCALLLGIREVARSRQLSLAIILFCFLLLLDFSLVAYNNGTVRAMGTASLMACVIVPTLLIGQRAGMVFLVLTSGIVFGLSRAEITGALPSLIPAPLGPTNQWIVFTFIILFHWVLVSTARNSLVDALERAREENAARKLAEENLRELNAILERRVAERTVELEREILEIKRVEKALNENESMLQAIIDNYPFQVFVKTMPDTKYILANRAWREMHGIGGTLHGQTDNMLFPNSVEQLGEEDKSIIETGKPRTYERTQHLPNGGKRFHLTTKFPVYREDRTIYAIGGVSVEITERKQAEEALHESERRYRSIFLTSGVSIWEEDFSEVKEVLDQLRSQGVTDFHQYFDEHPGFIPQALQMLKVIDVNEMTLALYGARDKIEFLASLDKIIAIENLDTFKEELIALAEGKSYFEGEVTDRTLQGNTINLWRTIVFPKENASFKNVLVCLTDITERKLMEEARARLEENLHRRNERLAFLHQRHHHAVDDDGRQR